jgi:hypothetical protein
MDGYRAAIAIAIQNGLVGDASLKGSRKTKWHAAAVFDEPMMAFLELNGVTTDAAGSAEEKAQLLAEAGIDFMKLNRENLWNFILTK